MRKHMLPGLVLAAALMLSAAFAGSAAAGPNTVGNAVCTTAACGGPSPITGPYDGFDPAYHCNNVLYTGPGDGVGDRSGNAYYAVGDADTSENPVTSPHNAAHEGDCTNDIVDGDTSRNDDKTVYPTSIILLRAVGYVNTDGGSVPVCPNGTGRNPGCPSTGTTPDEDAGYVGVGGPTGSATGATNDVDGGVKGFLPGPL